MESSSDAKNHSFVTSIKQEQKVEYGFAQVKSGTKTRKIGNYVSEDYSNLAKILMKIAAFLDILNYALSTNTYCLRWLSISSIFI